jgi:DedD protein
MDEGLKKRLIGAAVLASLAVIFVPMLFEEPPAPPPELPPMPEAPPQRDFASEMLREEVPAIVPLAPPPATPDVSVDEAPSETVKPRTGLTAWIVQVGSFSSRENAEQLVAKLRAADLPTPDAELVDIRGKRYYRVKVGPVIERSEADALLPRVNAVAGTDAAVRSYP